MNLLKAIIITIGSLSWFCQLSAQAVPKKILVEHFTNTRCSVCASRNPGFYNALNQKPEVLHIAYHPSSPYSNCLFSTQNKVENDARTKFYNLYGATPTFTINGQEKTVNDVQSPSVYNPYENKTTPISITINLIPEGSDSIKVIVTATAVAIHNLSTLTLYIPLVEKIVTYSSPNGETVHHDVFRKSFTGTNPITFIAPSFNGSSYFYSSKLAKNDIWNQDKLYAIAIIQLNDKSVEQSQSSAFFDKNITSASSELITSNSISILPNPAEDVIFFTPASTIEMYDIIVYDCFGSQVMKKSFYNMSNGMDVATLHQGMYFIVCKTKSGKAQMLKFLKH